MPREIVLRRGRERRVLLDVEEGWAAEPAGAFAATVAVDVLVAEDPLEEGMDTDGLAVGATCEILAKVPFPDAACWTTSVRRALALEGIVDRKPMRGGSTDGWVRLP